MKIKRFGKAVATFLPLSSDDFVLNVMILIQNDSFKLTCVGFHQADVGREVRSRNFGVAGVLSITQKKLLLF